MLFNFQLWPVEDIGAWGDAPPTLHWFSLTYGYYWLDVGQTEIFRYTQAIEQHWALTIPHDKSLLPYDEYQVSRLWEDLLQNLPDILDPVPDDLAQRIEDAEAWRQWQDDALDWSETQEGAADDLTYQALRWWGQRGWNSGYLQHPPGLWFWTVGDVLHIRWDNRNIVSDGLRVWEATAGETKMPVATFVAEVESFNARFLAAMSERVMDARRNWSRPDVHLDLDALERDQIDRSGWLIGALQRTTREYEWDAIRTAMAQIQAAMTVG